MATKKAEQKTGSEIEAKPDSSRAGWYWPVVGLLVVFYGVFMARDISRPFYGLHALAEAAEAWRGRAFLDYPLSYTKGRAVWAVGNPPQENPNPSLDHPQPGMMLWALELATVGRNEAAVRVWKIIRAMISLALLMLILRHLLEPRAALLAGMVFALLPISVYFGTGSWHFPLGMAGFWFYLVLIRGLKDGPAPRAMHLWGLGIVGFLGIQMNWEGVFFPTAIGLHYLGGCVWRRQWPQWKLFAVMAIPPLVSLIVTFGVMLAGFGWDAGKIVALYAWRGAGDGKLTWSTWLSKFWEFAVMNFTWPVLLAVLAALAGHVLGWVGALTGSSKDKTGEAAIRLPFVWLWVLPGVLQVLVFRGAMWWHHYWQRPFQPLVAIAVAVGVVALYKALAKVRPRAGAVAAWAFIGLCALFCVRGTNHYFSIRTFHPERVELAKFLDERMESGESLLALFDWIRVDNPVKGPYYRAELAWYLNRQIIKVQSLAEIKRLAATGKYPYYLLPMVDERLKPVAAELQRSGYVVVRSHQGDPGGKDRVGLTPYLLFDLRPARLGG